MMTRVFSLVKKYRYEVFGFVLLLLGIFVAAYSLRGQALTKRAYDPLRTTEARSEVVVVGIDDASLQELGSWPWKRNIFAELTKVLEDKGVKAVGYDVLFLEEREGDDAFKAVLNTVKIPVLLGSKNTGNTYYKSFFVDGSNSFVSSGLVNVLPDSDGKVRLYPHSLTFETTCVQPLAYKLFATATFKDVNSCTDASEAYFRYGDKIAEYSVIDILSGKINQEQLSGKIILIGSTSLDLNDYFISLSGEKIPGVTVHASILTSLLNQEKDVNSPRGISFITMCLFAIMGACMILYTRRTLYQILGVLLAALISIVLAALLFPYHIIIPLPWIVVALLSSSVYSLLLKTRHEHKQGDYVKNLFSKYVNKDVLNTLLATSAPISYGGEKRTITVLFSDLRGFTTLSETLQPETLMKLLNGYFSAMTESILKEEGTVDKFIGDAIMAFWNAPIAVTHHESHAVRAALMMMEALDAFNKEEGVHLQMGVGIHTGEAIVGNIGGKERVSYTALGDTVNSGSRIEGLTKKYGVDIIISEEVKSKLDEKEFKTRKLDEVILKGKNKKTILYEVIRDVDTEKLKEEYETAFKFYQEGDFEKVGIIFSKLAKEGDAPSKYLLERISQIKLHEDWNGVWVFDEK